ncbi:MAG: hypothetical protein KA479_01320 [Saprospiraceae bacterium]|nr:hypothetical protein [Saprospiraceae bacterium]
MSLGTLLLLISTIALVLTLTSILLLKSKRNWILQFLQFFSGTLFVISGYVKAVDPLGTAFKMEQYFAEFETAFSGTWMSFISPIFPFLASYSTAFALFMIVLEIAIGFMLVLGVWKKFTAWTFFIIILFFTILTGFTYLTAYVPSGVNFFSFGEWGPYVKSNMRVTDCGCFGDFIKLEPKTSFFKDLFLLIPAIFFLFSFRSFQSFFTPRIRNIVTGVLVAMTVLFCFRNVWLDEPITDFRPFMTGLDLKGQKAAEDDAMANVPMTMVMKNKADGRIVELPQEQYMKEFKNYPKDTWEYLDPIKGEPAIPITKVSDFEVADEEGGDVTDIILDYEGYQFLIISYALRDEGYTEVTQIKQDTIWATDTLDVEGEVTVVQRIEQIDQQTVVLKNYNWKTSFEKKFTEIINPFLKEASKDGVPGMLLTKFIDADKMADFRKDVGFDQPIYQADDILLKTIMRSNPGILLMHNGKIINKWHFRKLPPYQEVKRKFMP